MRALRGTPNSWPAIDLPRSAVVICIWLAVFIWGRAIWFPLPAKAGETTPCRRWSLKRYFCNENAIRKAGSSPNGRAGRTSQRRAVKRTENVGQRVKYAAYPILIINLMAGYGGATGHAGATLGLVRLWH